MRRWPSASARRSWPGPCTGCSRARMTAGRSRCSLRRCRTWSCCSSGWRSERRLRHARAVRVLVVGLAVVAVGCSTGSQRVERAPLPAQGQAAGAAPGRSEHLSSSGGVQRRWLAYLPRAAGVGAAPGMPLVFDLHGSGGTPEDQLELSGLEALAESEGFAVVAPEGIDRMWNVPVDSAKPSDVSFLSQLID